ncbi:zinc finger BED domain-containing protein RICESLEEPER 1-like [Pyrus ussuriensis x Pyrus communis]|uniref:Zinc finger BED domain-containing protein RICESLEEPER 1-like n=1 Tax=Pyrus ussuriensis x Pyrus communis TaxID=2448454 RepID=A0A5N5GZ58_9ROSA|nr:zinc finger BED domain-containing protein RICESLEEPER 1-like [Pyrus ussuriensis x Pyrus communis]
MKAKLDKYSSKCSLALAVAAILDPQFKLKVVEYYYSQIYGSTALDRIKEVSDGLKELFDAYSICTTMVDQEPVFPRSCDLKKLTWWKVHTPRYPILSMMALEVLGTPMSNVAPESAFNASDATHCQAILLDQSLQPDQFLLIRVNFPKNIGAVVIPAHFRPAAGITDQKLTSQVHEIVGRINGRFGTLTTVPMRHLLKYSSFDSRLSCALSSLLCPNKAQKGEWALDVVLEKSVVKQSSDAWRIILDSCLPVLHLIGTRCSIPYANKQIQELLGVSCAFGQAVQVNRRFTVFLLCKHVAVGNGHPVQELNMLLLVVDPGLNQEGGLDVFNFLHMVSTTNGEESTKGALVAEVDNLMVKMPHLPGEKLKHTASVGGPRGEAYEANENDTSSWYKTLATEPAASTWGIGKASEDTTPAWGLTLPEKMPHLLGGQVR